MTTAMTTMKKWQDEYLTTMARVEEPVLKVTGKAVEAVAEYIPARPRWEFLDQLPTMTEIVDSQLKFRQRVVDEQTAFVHKLMRTMTPAKASPAPRAHAPARDGRKASPVPKARVAAQVGRKASPVRRVRAKAA